MGQAVSGGAGVVVVTGVVTAVSPASPRPVTHAPTMLTLPSRVGVPRQRARPARS